jgi:hypothetical protein
MTDIQLLKVTELLNQYGNLIVKTEHTKADFLIRLSDDRWIQITHHGDKCWYLKGKLHRKGGPAIERANGDKEWYLNDKLHRTNGPAFEWANGNKQWYLKGKLHRTDGPAIEWVNGWHEWFLNGVEQKKPRND